MKTKLTRASGSEGKECGGRSKLERSMLSGGVIRLPTERIGFRGETEEECLMTEVNERAKGRWGYKKRRQKCRGAKMD